MNAIATKIFSLLILFLLAGFTIEQNNFYKVLASDSIIKIEHLLLKLETEKSSSKNNAYSGGLLAKKADFEKGVSAKIKTFKAGVKLLEQEITNHPKNTEYRFIRLSIQEHAPKILKYNKNITEDVSLINSTFSKQNQDLKKIISNYAKESKLLDTKLLK